ncbi:hypothetical protein FRB96_006880 [Tulasnella sp. 330]|nr:hypothetical protein FRB96_006880 [Tulasnella sp. 330]KAG8889363.1 hypothetical protein FRB98_004647 [Tulasnella sp. 332]
MSSSTSSTSPCSDASSSSGTRPTTESSPPSTISTSRSPPRTPRTPPARYPVNLSLRTTQLRPSRGNVSPGSGKPYTYQSLEDLLRAKGHQETRVFTPERGQSSSGDGATPSRDAKHSPEAADPGPAAAVGGSTTGVGDMVASLLSGWVPGASATMGRAKGRHIQKVKAEIQGRSTKQEGSGHDHQHSPIIPSPALDLTQQPQRRNFLSLGAAGGRVPRTALTNALESSLRKAQEPQGTLSRVSSSVRLPNLQVSHRQLQPESPTPLTPSSSSSTIRPSAHQHLQLPDHQNYKQPQSHLHPHPQLTPDRLAFSSLNQLRPNATLRHAASAPNVVQDRPRPHSRGAGIRPGRKTAAGPSKADQKRPQGWFNSFSRMVSYAAAVPTTARQADEPYPSDYPHGTSSRHASEGHLKQGMRPSSAANSRRHNQRQGRSQITTQHFMPRLVVPSAATVQESAVMCKSAPASRSGSRARESGRDASVRGKSRKNDVWAGTAPIATKKAAPGQPPLLSPSLTTNDEDLMAKLWGDDYDEVVVATHARQMLDDEDDDDAEPPNLAAILSMHLRADHDPQSRERSGSSSSESMEPELDSPIARRQRSIRSLRAHLATARATPDSDGVPDVPPLPARYATEEGRPFKTKLRLPGPSGG